MQQYSHDYTLIQQADESLYSAQRLHANECYDAALERINEARQNLGRYLAQDNMLPDNDVDNGWVRYSEAQAEVRHYQETQKAFSAVSREIDRNSEATLRENQELKAKAERHAQFDSRYLSKHTEGADPANPLYGKIAVMSGTFEQIGMERDQVAESIQRLGAKLNRSVSRTMQVFVMGNKVGPSKLADVEQFRAEGRDIQIISQIEFKEIVNKYLKGEFAET